MDFKSKQMKQSMFLISFGIILFWGLMNISILFDAVDGLMTILTPFLLGLAIAFIFNGPMVAIEHVLYGKKGPLRKINDRVKRPLSCTLTLIFFSVIVFILLFLVIPELTVALVELSNKIPGYLAETYDFAKKTFENNPFIMSKLEEVDWIGIEGNVLSFLKENSTSWLQNTFSVASSAVGSIINFGLAFVFSVYALLSKEQLIVIVKKILVAYLPKKTCRQGLAYRSFSK